ncbi:MAG: peptide chain release factor aRF-1 [Thermoplasmatales archaeon]|nr:peptide chain release factor aRF-1 [Candidatus Thermoplasmatota archaeon]MCL6002034.1 peptide chain release factor aRF-1 [Candidatus Thermoplasmatota archaeon]MDA8054606.1 peptide chain release factor aRF-1 [Thermoplasmatales archaeon]
MSGLEQNKKDIEKSLKEYQFKKYVDQIKKLEGRGTELISVYVPPERQISDVVAYLRDEYSTSSNIKSKTTRKNVTTAIESIMSKLRYYKAPPEHGLAIFVGYVPTRGDKSDMVSYFIEPPQSVTSFLYRCDSKFYLDPILPMLEKKEVYGLIVIDRAEATVGLLRGSRIEEIENKDSQVPSKHHQGGQSSRRYERLIELAAHEFFTKIGELASTAFLREQELKGVLIGGPGSTKDFFYKHGYLQYQIQEKVIDLYDVGYTNEYGLKELVDKASQTLSNLEVAKEKKIIERLLVEIKKGTGLAAYGDKEVTSVLNQGRVDTLIISKGLRKMKFTYRCENDGTELSEITQEEREHICPKCGKPMVMVAQADLIEEYIEKGQNSDSKIELVGDESDEGALFLNSFGGIGAILRYS